MVSASHNPAQDNGLKVLDAHGLKLDDAVEDELEQLIWQTEELAGVRNDDLGRMVDASSRLADYLVHRLGLAEAIDAGGLRLVLDARERLGLGGRAADPGRDRRPGRGHPRRPGRQQHQRPMRARPSPASLAARVIETGADAGFALDGDADRLIAVDAGGQRRRRRPGPRASSPSTGWAATRCPAAGSSCRSCRTAACRRSSRRPAARSSGRRSATSTSSRGCRSRARSWAARRAATSSSSSTPRRATGSSPRSRCSG